jgi:hypothetical protein
MMAGGPDAERLVLEAPVEGTPGIASMDSGSAWPY